MRYAVALACALLATSPAWAQSAAPAAGSGGGGPVGPSVSEPRGPTGQTPPGTPTANTIPEQISRDAAGQQIIGRTATPPSAVPGNTGGGQTGQRP